jgi:hypothetical protein
MRCALEPVMTRTRIDDDGRSGSDLSQGEDESGESGSGRRAEMGEARARPPVESARQVRAWRWCWMR